MSMNATDLCAILECMVGYKKLTEWVPAQSGDEAELKAARIDCINHVIELCNNELRKLSEVYQNE